MSTCWTRDPAWELQQGANVCNPTWLRRHVHNGFRQQTMVICMGLAYANRCVPAGNPPPLLIDCAPPPLPGSTTEQHNRGYFCTPPDSWPAAEQGCLSQLLCLMSEMQASPCLQVAFRIPPCMICTLRCIPGSRFIWEAAAASQDLFGRTSGLKVLQLGLVAVDRMGRCTTSAS
jgi:hypothetical protein